jgi:hypothetical protein
MSRASNGAAPRLESTGQAAGNAMTPGSRYGQSRSTAFSQDGDPFSLTAATRLSTRRATGIERCARRGR